MAVEYSVPYTNHAKMVQFTSRGRLLSTNVQDAIVEVEDLIINNVDGGVHEVCCEEGGGYVKRNN